ncbi:unnamed protein product [Didymodactylos carnosus]|uniref:Protein kinase domain-containing protein n=1 Tax=Didymodactylos carnosus TaxID=1234261 RepID=A0A815FBN5_9BILA|nr:unnamed protein product [Didymodactylos carnosus]CAF4177530.1 unnamed protein product [Didymodactylos carnosus]
MHHGVFRSLIMPHYCRPLANLPQLSEHIIYSNAKRIKEALEYVHSQNIVHMDVKSANVMVDMDGKWYLADFGSAKNIGEPVGSYTHHFYPVDITSKPALPSFDYYMFIILVIIELNKANWKSLLDYNNHMHIAHSEVVNMIKQGRTPIFICFLTDLLTLADNDCIKSL